VWFSANDAAIFPQSHPFDKDEPMMKRLLLLIFLVCCSAWASGRSWPLTYTAPKVQKCALGSSSHVDIALQNDSGKPITIKVKRLKAQLSAQQSAYFALGDKTTPARNSESQNTYTLAPHASSAPLTAYFVAGFQEGTATVVYRVFNVYNPNEYSDIEIKYEVHSNVEEEQLLYADHHIHISQIYPNPAHYYGEFSYRIGDTGSKSTLSIHNVLGKSMGKFALDPSDHRLLISLKDWMPGVYFYTLHINDRSIVTKKFIVRH
jgi:hypothetical protein